jgi:hypothetical protein
VNAENFFGDVGGDEYRIEAMGGFLETANDSDSPATAS